MNKMANKKNLRPEGELSALLWDVCVAVRERGDKENPFGHATFDTLDVFSRIASKDAFVAKNCEQMKESLVRGINASISVDDSEKFNRAYREAKEHALPVSTEFLKRLHELRGLTSDHSLNSMDNKRIMSMEADAYNDKDLRSLLNDISSRLKQIKSVPDLDAYAQAYERYCEAVVYAILKDKFPNTKKISENAGKSGSTPDFCCELDGKVFYVEVKSLDIVDGRFRRSQMLDDALDTNVQLEDQLKSGKAIASAIGEIAPYQKYRKECHGQCGTECREDYDPRSLNIVIESLRGKARQAFKSSQFELGPTLALAVCNRLLIPGGRYSLAPYYYDPYPDGAVVSWVWWHACFGRNGTPVLRQPEFAGKPSLECYLSKDGLFVDETETFPGVALLSLNMKNDGDELLGLFDSRHDEIDGWFVDDTERVLGALCTAFNDNTNDMAYQLSKVK